MVEAEAKPRSDSQVITLFIEKGQAIYLVIEAEAKSRSDSQVTTLLIQRTSLVCQSLDIFQFLC